ncbi:Ferredoxin, 2Fe-2S [Nitrospina gracilis 3/211]|uniref:Ferredoxin, 2Fe-2S n=2 Tax=Nitrospina TaxID=35800 RepID=M1ZCM4_NITG3|nr:MULTISPECIES: (2Fe-2S) ferredoxin domain-containing protein [Nitrospina]MCF8723993.1 (2Fe-2S) ferredoxin [Nitrospina sp. Nb-3]CAI2718744.1 Ferredoxin, 2Fe-2S [Nitrospina watsonii]CCQ91118.1 Ferredoxin, 2Fe-2S [Nitrospina gracilis 3/211]
MGRFTRHVFICNNQRKEDDPRGCCQSRGAMDLLDHIKKRVHDSGLKGKIRINKAGCLDACQYGPSMVVYPDDVWYSPQTVEDMEEIFTEHLQNGRVVERLVIDFSRK